MIEEVSDIGHEQAVESAFLKSESHMLGNEQLQPYSAARMVAAQAMGLHYGNVDDAGKDRFKKSKVYPGALRDVAIVLWLCSITSDNDLDAAARAPVEAAKKAIAWAEAKGIVNTAGEQFWTAYLIFFDIMNEVESSRVKASKKKDTVITTIQPAQT